MERKEYEKRRRVKRTPLGEGIPTSTFMATRLALCRAALGEGIPSSTLKATGLLAELLWEKASPEAP